MKQLFMLALCAGVLTACKKDEDKDSTELPVHKVVYEATLESATQDVSFYGINYASPYNGNMLSVVPTPVNHWVSDTMVLTMQGTYPKRYAYVMLNASAIVPDNKDAVLRVKVNVDNEIIREYYTEQFTDTLGQTIQFNFKEEE